MIRKDKLCFLIYTLILLLSSISGQAQDKGQVAINGHVDINFQSYNLVTEYFLLDKFAGTVTINSAWNSDDNFGINLNFRSSTTAILLGAAYFIKVAERMYIPLELKAGYQFANLEGAYVGGGLLHTKATIKYIMDSGFAFSTGPRFQASLLSSRDHNVRYFYLSPSWMLGVGYYF